MDEFHFRIFHVMVMDNVAITSLKALITDTHEIGKRAYFLGHMLNLSQPIYMGFLQTFLQNLELNNGKLKVFFK